MAVNLRPIQTVPITNLADIIIEHLRKCPPEEVAEFMKRMATHVCLACYEMRKSENAECFCMKDE